MVAIRAKALQRATEELSTGLLKTHLKKSTINHGRERRTSVVLQSMSDLLPLSEQCKSKKLASEQLVTQLTDECSSRRRAEETCRPWQQQGKHGSTRTFQTIDRVAVLIDECPSRGAACDREKEDCNVKNPHRKCCGRWSVVVVLVVS
jgi:hypothetical protein